MVRFFAAVTVAASSFALATLAFAGQATFKATLIVPGHSIGGVAIGMTFKQARSAWGPGARCLPTTRPSSCRWRGTRAQSSAMFLLTRRRVTSVALGAGADQHGPRYSGPIAALRTANGIRFGSTEAEFVAAYPSAVKAPHGTRPAYHLAAPDATTTFFFDIGTRTLVGIGISRHK